MKKSYNVYHVQAPDAREQRRRKREILSAVVLLALVVGGTWTQLSFYGLDSWLFIVLFNINSVLMFVILFLVARNVVKLIMERRRKVFGAQIRSQLVMIFILLSLVPTVLMFLAANRVVKTSVDYWFTRQTESALEAALDVGRSFYLSAAERLQARSVYIMKESDKQSLIPVTNTDMQRLVRKQEESGLTFLGVVAPNTETLLWHTRGLPMGLWNTLKTLIEWERLKEASFFTTLFSSDKADYVIGVLAVQGGQGGYLLTAERIGQGLMVKLDRLTQGFDEYTQLKQLKKPLKVSFQLILGVLGLITIFGSIWFGFRLSKEWTAPILALAEGTMRISRGELDFRLADKGSDEMAHLIRSFNDMAEDLQQSQASITGANTLLAKQNELMDTRRRYIETVLENITTGVITLNSAGRVETINQAARTTFGVSSEDLCGHDPLVFLPEPYIKMFEEMLTTLKKHPDQRWQRHVDFHMENRLWKLVVHALALSGVGQSVSFVIVIDDITELEKMQRMAAWREVARRIAHEIKNPLTPIKLSAQRLTRKFAPQIQDPVFKQCTEMIVKQSERLQAMVQEFSAFAKLPEISLRPERLEPLIEEAVVLFRTSHGQINWQTRLASDLPSLMMDPAAMQRVLLNLLSNAAEALSATNKETEKDAPQVIVSAQVDHRLQVVRLTVVDNGPGLTSEERTRMFEPYFSRKKGGTGLGLAIVKSIVADHRGTVRAVPGQRGGTVLLVELPYC